MADKAWRCFNLITSYARLFHYLTEAPRLSVIARSEATWQSTKPSQEGYGWQRSHKRRPLRKTLDRHASLTMTKYKFVIQSKQKPL